MKDRNKIEDKFEMEFLGDMKRLQTILLQIIRIITYFLPLL